MKTRTAGTAAAECDQRTKRWRVAVSQSNRSHARTFPDGRRLHGASPPAENFAGLILPAMTFFIWKRLPSYCNYSCVFWPSFPNAPDFESAIPRFESWRRVEKASGEKAMMPLGLFGSSSFIGVSQALHQETSALERCDHLAQEPHLRP